MNIIGKAQNTEASHPAEYRDGESALERTKRQIEELESLGRYHSLQLPGEPERPGLISSDTLWKRWHKLGIPTNLGGLKILDVGCWDGWFTVTAASLGAVVTSVDLVENKRMREVANQLAPAVSYKVCSIYNVPQLGESYDIVFCFGVLYHLRHPLLGLEAICQVTRHTAYIETFVTDTEEAHRSSPILEFYESVELRGQFDNWCGPNIACVAAMLRSAGFAQVAYLGNLGERGHFVAHRRIPADPSHSHIPKTAARIWAVTNAIDHGYILKSDTDGFACVWCEVPEEFAPRINHSAVRFGRFDSAPVSIHPTGPGAYQIVVKVPPGTDAGVAVIHLRLHGHQASNDFRAMVDSALPAKPNAGAQPRRQELRLLSVQDAQTGEVGSVKIDGRTYLTAWIEDLSHALTLRTISCRLGGIDLLIDYLSEPNPKGLRQANCQMPSGLSCPQGGTQLKFEIYWNEVLEDATTIFCFNSQVSHQV